MRSVNSISKAGMPKYLRVVMAEAAKNVFYQKIELWVDEKLLDRSFFSVVEGWPSFLRQRVRESPI